MNVKSRPARCAMFAVSPVSRLSIPITSYPRSSRASERWDPMKPAAPVMTTRFLEGMPVQTAEERQPHDLEIEAHGPVFDVIEVVLDPFLDRGVAPPAVHLRPAGDARLDLVAQHVLRNPVLELLD